MVDTHKFLIGLVVLAIIMLGILTYYSIGLRSTYEALVENRFKSIDEAISNISKTLDILSIKLRTISKNLSSISNVSKTLDVLEDYINYLRSEIGMIKN